MFSFNKRVSALTDLCTRMHIATDHTFRLILQHIFILLSNHLNIHIFLLHRIPQLQTQVCLLDKQHTQLQFSLLSASNKLPVNRSWLRGHRGVSVTEDSFST